MRLSDAFCDWGFLRSSLAWAFPERAWGEAVGCACSLAGADPEERVTTGQLLLQSFYEDQDRAMRLGGLHHSSLAGLSSAIGMLHSFALTSGPPKTGDHLIVLLAGHALRRSSRDWQRLGMPSHRHNIGQVVQGRYAAAW